MYIVFDTINILIGVTALANLLYGFAVYARQKKSHSNTSFFVFTSAIAFWCFSMVLFRSAVTVETATALARMLYLAAATIPPAFVYFAYQFPSHKPMVSGAKKIFLLTTFLLTVGISLVPNALIATVVLSAPNEPFIIFNNTLHQIYAVYIAGLFMWTYVVLIYRYLHSTDALLRTQLIYIFIGPFISSSIAMVTNLLLPLYGVFDLNWLGQISIAIMTGIITYGIFKHHIFNVRVIVTELLMFFLWLTALMRIIFSENIAATIFNTAVFAILIIIGLWLIKGANKEVEAREHIEQLAEKLKKTNERLRELDQHKSEFLSIATHQLRGPLAAIRGHLSLMLDGSYGDIPEKPRDIVHKVFDSSTLMAQTIDDFLNVSRIEQGSVQYNKSGFDCADMLKGVAEELRPSAHERDLSFSLEIPKDTHYFVHADYAKLRYVFFNLIENAIKYTPSGSVSVVVERDDARKVVRVSVQDSGVGIEKKELGRLFEKFVRARGAAKVNVEGSGLGLYVARKMIEAHDGRIWARSNGKGKGATFIVELPLVEKKAA